MTLVWDDAGTRYYETGVSRGILWTPELLKASLPGVPWNGLVSIALDPQGGEAEHYYFDGVKYMDKVLAEDFQATIQFIQAPNEFRACEGVREYKPGVMTEMNKRDKFHMAWRTEISSDEGQSVAYKWHIAYNNLAQPAGRAYQTIADTTTMDIRNVVITATPACGRHSYFWFDSRDYDLTALEAQLNAGTLPMCYELASLVAPISGGGGGGGSTPDPDAGCDSFLVDLENYFHGQTLVDEVLTEGTTHSATINGLINNGLDIIELPAVGAFAANDSAASEVGTGDILADDDDATYITSADGDLGYTVGLPPLVGYVDGAALELHIRMSISGGVNPDDPDNLDADAQVHISTDAGGDDTVGGFSDGADEGMGFALTVVDGTIVDYVVPLYMDSWVDTTLDDVITALEAGAYLNVVAVSNNNPDTTPEVRVYEAKIVMLNDTDPDKFLRCAPGDVAYIDQYIYDTGTTTLTASNTTSVDFKVAQIPFDVTLDGSEPTITEWGGLFSRDARLDVTIVGTEAHLEWHKLSSDDLLATLTLDPNEWYTAEVYWGWTSMEIKVWKREDDSKTLLLHETHDTTNGDPGCNVRHHPGFAGSAEASYEVVIDNAGMQVHCNEEPPPAPVTVELPATVITSAPGNGAKGSNWFDDSLSVENNATGFTGHTQLNMPEFVNASREWLVIGKYGSGSKKLNFDLPAGATLVSIEYVLRAYREGSFANTGDATASAATSYFGTTTPASLPAVNGMSSDTGANAYFSDLVVTTSWSSAAERVITDPNPSATLTNDQPFDWFTAVESEALTSVVKVDYLAARITYTP